eukprot:Em0008g215a
MARFDRIIKLNGKPVARHILCHPNNGDEGLPIEVFQSIALCDHPGITWQNCLQLIAAADVPDLPDTDDPDIDTAQMLLYQLMHCSETSLNDSFEVALYSFIIAHSPQFAFNIPEMMRADDSRIAEIFLMAERVYRKMPHGPWLYAQGCAADEIFYQAKKALADRVESSSPKLSHLTMVDTSDQASVTTPRKTPVNLSFHAIISCGSDDQKEFLLHDGFKCGFESALKCLARDLVIPKTVCCAGGSILILVLGQLNGSTLDCIDLPFVFDFQIVGASYYGIVDDCSSVDFEESEEKFDNIEKFVEVSQSLSKKGPSVIMVFHKSRIRNALQAESEDEPEIFKVVRMHFNEEVSALVSGCASQCEGTTKNGIQCHRKTCHPTKRCHDPPAALIYSLRTHCFCSWAKLG